MGDAEAWVLERRPAAHPWSPGTHRPDGREDVHPRSLRSRALPLLPPGTHIPGGKRLHKGRGTRKDRVNQSKPEANTHAGKGEKHNVMQPAGETWEGVGWSCYGRQNPKAASKATGEGRRAIARGMGDADAWVSERTPATHPSSPGTQRPDGA